MNCVLCEKEKDNYIKIKDYKVCNDCYSEVKVKRVVNRFLNSFSKDINEQEKALKSFQKLIDKFSEENRQDELISAVSQKYSKNIKSKTRLIKSIKNLSSEEVSHLREKVEHNNFSDLKNNTKLDFLNPKELKSKMDNVIIGQENAKFEIANALSQFSVREKDKRISKPNIFISGPTGTGKTEFSRFISKELKLPLVTVDATLVTSSGYEGLSINELIFNLLMSKNGGDLKRSENSIVFIDEIDKKTKGLNSSEIGAVSVQMELLRILEDGYVQGVYNKEKQTIRTSNIIFIVAGAFSNLQNDMFFSMKDSDLIEVGIMPEFLARFQVVTQTRALTKKEIKKILTEKKNNILFTNKLLFKKFNVELDFSEEFINEVVEEAMSSDLGIRMLNRIVSNKIKNVYHNIFDYFGKKIVLEESNKLSIN